MHTILMLPINVPSIHHLFWQMMLPGSFSDKNPEAKGVQDTMIMVVWFLATTVPT
jgi:hypothetical protein